MKSLKRFGWVAGVLACAAVMLSCGGGGGGGDVAAPQQPLPLVAPAAPTSLEAETLSAATVRITWADESGNEEGFQLERSSAAGAFEHVRDLPPNITSFVDRALVAETQYAYRVRAFNSAGSSDWAPAEGASGGGGPVPPGLAQAASALTASIVLFRYEMDVPSFSTLGTFQVRLRSTGALSTSSLFIQEATDWGFTQNVRTFNYGAAPPVTQLITGRQPGTYYYRGGGGVGRSAAVSAPKAVVVGSQSATVFATFDNTIVWDSENVYTNEVLTNDLLAVGNNYWAGGFGIDTLMINQSLLYFDLDTLIGAASVTKATLRLTAFVPAADFGTDYVCAAIAEDWAPNAVTGANGPDFFVSNTVTRPPPIPTGNGGVLTLDFDVTGIVSRWVSGQWTNFGLILFDASTVAPLDTRLRTTFFESLEFNRGYETRPKLIIEFQAN